MKRNQIKIGAVISYILIAVNSVYGLFLTPFMLGHIGEGEYGVYQTICAFSSSLLVLDLGLGGTVMRYVARYTALGRKRDSENFCGMAALEATIIGLFIIVIAIIAFALGLVRTVVSSQYLVEADALYFLVIINMALTIGENVIFGIITGNNRFIFGNSTKLVRVLMRIALVYILLPHFSKATTLMFIDVAVSVILIAAELIYVKKVLKYKVRIYKWDWSVFKESSRYMLLMLGTSLANLFNGTVDKLVIGHYMSEIHVTIYSIGITMFTMFEHFATSFSDLMLPSVTRQIAGNCTNRDLEDTVIKMGRLQFMVLGAALAGFTIIGNDFITKLWIGKESYHTAWIVALMLMVPSTIPLIQNVCLSILRAKNKIAFRTWAVCIMAVANLVLTILGVKIFRSVIWAAAATGFGLVCANIIAMNIYYIKVIKLNVFRIFRGIFKGILPCLLVASAALLVSYRLIGCDNWFKFLLQVGIFAVVYAIALILFGMNSSEKKSVFGRLHAIKENI